MCCPRGRGLVENEEQDENEKMKSSVVEEQEEEEGSEGESETGFVDLDQDTLLNVLERVDVVTLGRAAGVNKLWRNVARDNRLWEPIALRLYAGCSRLEFSDELRHVIRSMSFRTAFCCWIRLCVAKSKLNTPSDYNSIPDFYSIDPQVFSRQIRPWVQN